MDRWKVKIASFLKERTGRFKPATANKMGLKRIEKIDFSGTYHLVNKHTNTDMILVKKGDLLISGINAEKGAVTIYNEEDAVLATIHYSSYEFDKSKIYIDYFKWFLISDAFKNLLKASAGNGIKTELKAKQLLPLEINLPPLDQQLEIVERISDSQAKLKTLTKEIVHQQTYLQRLRQAILQEVVRGKLTKQDPTDEPATELLKRIKTEKEKLIKAGKLKKEKELPPITDDEIPFELPKGWAWCRLGEIVLKSEAGKSLVCDKRPAEINEWGIIKVSAMSWGKFDEQENKVLPKGVRPFVEYKINEGDYLISRANTEELIGKSVIVGELQANLLLSDKSIRIKFSDFVDNHYINFYNNSLIAREYYKRVASGTSDSMKNITREQMYLLPLPLPPLAEQQRIVAKVQQLQRHLSQLEVQVQQSRQYAEQLLQSVLKEAFEEKGKVYEENEMITMAAEE